MNVLLDANIPARLAEAGLPQQQIAVDGAAALIRRGDSPCLVPPVLYEFWVVATTLAFRIPEQMTASRLS
jgi:hypothetical protein